MITLCLEKDASARQVGSTHSQTHPGRSLILCSSLRRTVDRVERLKIEVWCREDPHQQHQLLPVPCGVSGWATHHHGGRPGQQQGRLQQSARLAFLHLCRLIPLFDSDSPSRKVIWGCFGKRRAKFCPKLLAMDLLQPATCVYQIESTFSDEKQKANKVVRPLPCLPCR